MQQAYCNTVANGTSVTKYPSVFYMEIKVQLQRLHSEKKQKTSEHVLLFYFHKQHQQHKF